jgi:hypothetical protein
MNASADGLKLKNNARRQLPICPNWKKEPVGNCQLVQIGKRKLSAVANWFKLGKGGRRQLWICQTERKEADFGRSLAQIEKWRSTTSVCYSRGKKGFLPAFHFILVKYFSRFFSLIN